MSAAEVRRHRFFSRQQNFHKTATLRQQNGNKASTKIHLDSNNLLWYSVSALKRK